MANFTYSARNKTGGIEKGTLFASDRPAATANLIEKGFSPILVKEIPIGTTKSAGILDKLKFGQKVKLSDKVIFSRQFSTMINAGVPIVQSLAILKEQTESKVLAGVVADLSKQVEGGSTLANALGSHPKIFNPIFINMVRAGETGGILDEVLNRLATQQEKDAAIVAKLKGALTYPGLLFSVAIGVFFLMMTVIVPKLTSVFADSGTKLPIYTVILLAISHFLVKFALLIIVGTVIGVISFTRYIATPAGKRWLDYTLIKAPIFGPILVKVNVARFARTFSSLMSSGISVLDAISATRDAIGSTVYQDILDDVAKAVKNGRPMSEPVRASKYFPPIVGQMIAVGEETGQLDDILLKLAVFYEGEVDTVIASLSSILEPIIIIVLGGMVGIIAVAVIGPIAALEGGGAGN
jgi:type IV pilus assembly protein PilC